MVALSLVVHHRQIESPRFTLSRLIERATSPSEGEGLEEGLIGAPRADRYLAQSNLAP